MQENYKKAESRFVTADVADLLFAYGACEL